MTVPPEIPKRLASASGAGRDGPLVVGLTGPIGCGKSAVARMLGEVGATVIDADVLARRATEPGTPALPEIREHFGAEVFTADGELDRAALGRIVFADSNALAELERIVHPHVRRMVEDALSVAEEASDPVVAIEAIKLVEGGLAAQCDEVWLVDCGADTQRSRLAARGMPAADAEQRLGAQGADLADRLSTQLGHVPHRRLSTEGSLEQTRQRVEEALADALGRHR